MDYTTITVAVIASLPGIFAIVSQVRKEQKELKLAKERTEIEERKTEIDAIEVTRQSVTVLLDPLNKRISTLESLGEDCKRRVTEFEKLIGVKEARIRELEDIVAQKDVRISVMQKEIDELRERVSVLEKNGNGGKQ